MNRITAPRRLSPCVMALGMLLVLSGAALAAPLFHTISDSQVQGTFAADTFDANGFPVSLYWPDVGVLVYKDCGYEGSDLRCATYDRNGNFLGDTLIEGFQPREGADPDSLHMGTERITPWWNRTAARTTADVLQTRVQRSLFGVQPQPVRGGEDTADGADPVRRERITPPAPPAESSAEPAQPAEPSGRVQNPTLEPPLNNLDTPAPAGQPDRYPATSLPVETVAPSPSPGPMGGPGRIDLQPLEIVRAQTRSAPSTPLGPPPTATPQEGGGERIHIQPLQFISSKNAVAPTLAAAHHGAERVADSHRIVLEPVQVVRPLKTAAPAERPMRGMAAGDTESRYAVWLDGVLAQLENDKGGASFDGNLYLGMVGADYRLGNRMLAGLAAGYEYVDFDTGFNSGELTARGLTISPYAGFQLAPNLILSAVSGFTFITGDQSRREPFAPIDAEFDAFRFMIAADMSYRQALTDALHLTGSVGYLYSMQYIDSFSQSDGEDVDSITEDVGQIRALAQGTYAMGRLEPYVKLAYLYDVQLSEESLDRDEAWVAAGVSYRTGDRMRVDAEASTSLFRDDYVDNRLRAGFRYEF